VVGQRPSNHVPLRVVGVNSPYRKYALFVCLCREEKAQTYVKWIFRQSFAPGMHQGPACRRTALRLYSPASREYSAPAGQRLMRRTLLIAAKLTGVLVLAFALAVLALALTHHRPPTYTTVDIGGRGSTAGAPVALKILTWNLGYAGLGSEADFFMDGGTGVLAQDEPTVRRHLANIIAELRREAPDVAMLQEVDSGSRRSYWVDERAAIISALPDRYSSYALNFNVTYVPYPFTRPTGKVRSGVMSLGHYLPDAATRVQLPGAIRWPISAFVLDRCALVWQVPTAAGHHWVLINVHLSAYDSGGMLRAQQLAFLKEYVARLYARDDYVVVGGDWNAILPGIRPDQFPSHDKSTEYYFPMPRDFSPAAWKWAVPFVPTNRVNNSAYQPGKNYVTVIDGFLVSPNVDIRSVATVSLGFRDSDHEPVVVELAAHPGASTARTPNPVY